MLQTCGLFTLVTAVFTVIFCRRFQKAEAWAEGWLQFSTAGYLQLAFDIVVCFLQITSTYHGFSLFHFLPSTIICDKVLFNNLPRRTTSLPSPRGLRWWQIIPYDPDLYQTVSHGVHTVSVCHNASAQLSTYQPFFGCPLNLKSI